MAEARSLLGEHIAVQGNLDPCVLLGELNNIRDRMLEVIQQAGSKGHIVNLGSGVLPNTPEENARFFFDIVKA